MRRKVIGQAAKPPRKHLDGAGYAAVMQFLRYGHEEMAAELGVTRWCSISWKTGRRPISSLAENAIRSLVLRRYAAPDDLNEADARFADLKAS